jgi:hypothetical protein
MKKLFILTTLLVLALCAPAYAVLDAVTSVDTTLGGDCTFAADNITMTCSTQGEASVFLSIDYTKGGEDTVTITPKHNWLKAGDVAGTTFYAIGKENYTTVGLMDNLYFTFSATQTKTVVVPCPSTASKMQFVVSFSGSENGTTKVKLAVRVR